MPNAGATTTRRLRMWAVAGAVLAALVVVMSVAGFNSVGLVSSEPSASQTAITPTGAGTVAPATLPSLSVLEAAMGTSALWKATGLPESDAHGTVAAESIEAILTDAAHQTGLTTDGGLPTWINGALAGIIVAEVVGVAIACGAAVVPACVGLIIALAVTVVVAYFLGQTAASNLSLEALNWARAQDVATNNELGIEWAATLSIVSALNLSETAFGYEASSAALAQLNGTADGFSIPLDLTNSTVASQLASVALGEFGTADSAVLTTFQAYNQEFTGTGGYASSGACDQLAADAEAVEVPVSCGTSGTPSLGTLYVGWDVDAGYPFYIEKTSSVGIAGGACSDSATEWSLEFVPLYESAATPIEYLNESCAPTQWMYNFTYPSDGYIIHASEKVGATWETWAPGDGLLITDGFPLENPSTEVASWEAWAFTNDAMKPMGELGGGGSFMERVPDTSCVADNTYADCLYWTGGLTGTSAISGADLISWLWAIASSAGVTGATYYAFLTLQGYTTASQVPAKCVIPPVGNIFPPDTSLSEIDSLNVTDELNLYLSYLTSLGVDYNLTEALTTENFCGSHLHTPSGGLGITWGTLAYGSVYVPDGLNEKGTGPQNFSNVSTWNITKAQIIVLPTLGNISATMNVRWELPSADVNPTGLWALLNGSYTATGYLLYPQAFGNSSRLGGSEYPVATSGSAGFAIDITSCQTYNDVTDKWVNQTATCGFLISNFTTYVDKIVGPPPPPPFPLSSCALFSISSLECLVLTVVEVIVIVVVIVAVVAAVVWVWRRD